MLRCKVTEFMTNKQINFENYIFLEHHGGTKMDWKYKCNLPSNINLKFFVSLPCISNQNQTTR